MQTAQDNKPISLEVALKKHLSQNRLGQPSGQLFGNILSRLEIEKELRAQKPKTWGAAALVLGSLVLLVVAFNVSWQAFGQTQTFRYLSLLFTDFKTVMDNWQDYGFSVLETLPLGAMAFLLGSAIASLFLIDLSARQIKNFRKLSHAEHSHSH